MKKITMLIPHNKMPHLHDLATIQYKMIVTKLQERANIEVTWVMFPTEEGTNFDASNPNIINASSYNNALEILERVKPDLVLINGSMDFHNVSISLACKFKNIPTVVIFFRNFLNVISNPKSKSIKTRIRKILYVPNFYMKQIVFLSRTLRKMNFSHFKTIKFILGYSKMVFSTYFPISDIISGDVNLCTNQIWKEKLIDHKFKESSIFIVGDPYFDPIFTKIHNSNLKNNPNTGKTKILFCTSTMFGHGFCSRKEENELIIATINEILKHKDLEISLKIHPSTVSREDYEKEVLPKLSSSIKFYQREDLVDLINVHDLMLTYGGTGAIHYGVLMRKPIVNLDFGTNATSNNVFTDNKIIIQSKDLSNLALDIRESKNKIISEDDIQKYIQRYIGIFDGKNSYKAADIIFNFLCEIGLIS